MDTARAKNHIAQCVIDALFLKFKRSSQFRVRLESFVTEVSDLHFETTTIMFADVVESVRLIEQDERLNVVRIRALLKELAEIIAPQYQCKVLERRGDGLLLKFVGALHAAQCALHFHQHCAAHNGNVDAQNTIALRIGIHSAEVMSDEAAIYGQGINLAARVAALAGPGETIASATVRDQLVQGLDVDIEDLGNCYLKHVPEPIRAFRVGRAGCSPLIPEGAAAKTQALPTIAILLFDSEKGEASTVAQLLGETLTHYISRAGSLTVIAWLSSKLLSNSSKSISELGQALKADWLVSGSCHLIGSKVLVSAQLIRVSSEQVEYSERLTFPIEDLLAPESELAASLAKSFVYGATESEARRVASHALPSLSSHSLLLGAVGLMHRSGPADFHRGREALEHLLERQPRMHSARPWLAKWYVLRTTRGLKAGSTDEANRALDQTSRALDSSGNDAFALAIQGFVYFHMLRDVSRAEALLSQAVLINPNEPLAMIFNAAVVSEIGRHDEAWAMASHSLTLSPFDPLRPYMRMIAASCALSADNFEAAQLLCEQSLKENIEHPATWRTFVIALARLGKIDEARSACTKMMLVDPGLTLSAYAARPFPKDDLKRWALDALRVAGVPEG
jgi:adenylate cyclase